MKNQIKITMLTFTLAMILIFAACKSSDIPLAERIDNGTRKDNATAEDDFENEELPEVLRKPLTVPLNINAEEIYYYGEANIVSGGVSDGENIYILGDQNLRTTPYEERDEFESRLFIMPVGSDEVSVADIDVPKGIYINNIAIDLYGGVHLFIADWDNEEYFIWQLDDNYQVGKIIEISANIIEKWPPLWFLVDHDGNYYIQCYRMCYGVLVSSEGELINKFTYESLGIKWAPDIGLGKDGQIYIIHGNDDKTVISTLDTENGLLIEDPDFYFPGYEIISAISGGTDTNLLIYSRYSGVWAYDAENRIFENRVPMSESSFGYASEFGNRIFLPDGRLFLGVSIWKDYDQGEDADCMLFRYIPVEKN